MISCSITEVKISIREYFREKAENKRNPPTTTVYTKEMRQAICREHEERFGTGYKLENVGNSKKFSKFNIIDRRPDNQAPLAEA